MALPSARTSSIYFVSNRSGFLNVWGRHFDPEAGKPVGDAFKVTNFDDLRQVLPTDMNQAEISVSGNRLYLPVTEVSATIWSLDGVDR